MEKLYTGLSVLNTTRDEKFPRQSIEKLRILVTPCVPDLCLTGFYHHIERHIFRINLLVKIISVAIYRYAPKRIILKTTV